jgi:hypothetical protein
MKVYRKGCRAEFEAIRMLESRGYEVVRRYRNGGPPDLLVFTGKERLMLMVRGFHAAVPDARAVSFRCHDDLEAFRRFRHAGDFSKELWTLAPPFGWRFYEVLPGGLRAISREEFAPRVKGVNIGEVFRTPPLSSGFFQVPDCSSFPKKEED